MNLFPLTNSRLPGIRGFLKKNPMFRQTPGDQKPTGAQLLEALLEAIRNGRYRPGDRFPTPGEISDSTGASLVDSLESVNSLLRSQVVCQTLEGRLFVRSNRR